MKIFWLWTAFCLGVAGVLAVSLIRDSNYTGTDITFSTNRDQLVGIDAKAAVTIEAASDRFFAFRNGAETVIGVLTPKPLGWDGREYYTAGPVEIKNGTWIVETGRSITIRLNSSESMAVREAVQGADKLALAFVSIALAGLLWVLGLLLGTSTT